jgi:hypothetical protein
LFIIFFFFLRPGDAETKRKEDPPPAPAYMEGSEKQKPGHPVVDVSAEISVF